MTLLAPTCVWAKVWFADQAESRASISRQFQSTPRDQLTGPRPPTPMPNRCATVNLTTVAAAATSATRAPEAGRRSPFCSLRQAASFYVRSTSNRCGAVALPRGEKRAWVHSHFPTATAATRASQSPLARPPFFSLFLAALFRACLTAGLLWCRRPAPR